MILSDKDIQERLIKEPQTAVGEAKEWWEKGEWSRISDKLLIDPFDENRLGAADYKLSVGDEYILLRDPRNTRPLAVGERIELGPGETALILTEEFIGLPPNLMGFIVPRARRLFEGTTIFASRIDPSWYGKLLIGFTNLSKFPTSLYCGDAFCTFYLIESGRTHKPLTKREVEHLGRTRIGKIEYPSMEQRHLVKRQDVRDSDITEIEETFGRPFDIVFGAIEQSRKATIDYVEREIAPKIAVSATDSAVKTAFRRQHILLTILIGGLLTLIGGFLAYFYIIS